jgi:hypothetical protein
MPPNYDDLSVRSRGPSVGFDRSEVLPVISRPKALFLLAATISFLLSVGLFFSGDRERGIFVAIWVPSILSAGALLLGKEDRRE